ncbi:MAG: type III-B CRISPR module-associated protein Cmr5 [Desulfobacteraceae bacterium]
MESKISGLEQGRAKFAYECAKEGSLLDKKKEYKDKNDKSKEYKAYTKKIPMLIKTNGLGATFAFMLSKGGTYEFIGEQILDWLKADEKGLLPSDQIINSFEKLNNYIISEDSSKYRMITIEVLAFFSWLRRFAEGLIEGDDNE